jgi:hydroxypyruvate reductase
VDEPAFLQRLFGAALRAADPRLVLPPALPEKPRGRCIVVGAGKAAALMAQAVDAAWPDVALSGVVVTRYGHAAPGWAGRIEVLQAGHPVPDAASEIAARRIMAAVRGLAANDLVLVLISGGGSAVMALPAPGLALADKQALTRRLLASGATISEINAVRRHLSAIKGGRLAAAAAPARVVTLAISDVPGDEPTVIASGPTVPDAGTPPDVMAILERYGLVLPPGVQPLPAVPYGAMEYRLIATPAMALAAAADAARREGVAPLILGDALEGEAREAGRVLAGMALSCRRHATPAPPRCVLLSGGETTVTLGAAPSGRGGRNTEFLLATAYQLRGTPGIWALACDTDGIDGTEDAAGAWAGPDLLERARGAGFDAADTLAQHDSYSLFKALNGLIVTGPTLTNVNDFRAILIT